MSNQEQNLRGKEDITQAIAPTDDEVRSSQAYTSAYNNQNIRDVPGKGIPDNFAQMAQTAIEVRNTYMAPYDNIFQALPENSQISEDELLTSFDGTILGGRQAVRIQIDSGYARPGIIERYDVMTRQRLSSLVTNDINVPDVAGIEWRLLNTGKKPEVSSGGYETETLDDQTQQQLQLITRQFVVDRAAWLAQTDPAHNKQAPDFGQWRAQTFMKDRLQNTPAVRAASADKVGQMLKPQIPPKG